MPIRRTPQLPISHVTLDRTYGLMAERLVVETDDPRVLAAADASFGRFAVPGGGDGSPPLVVRLFRDPTAVGGGTRTDGDAIPTSHRTHGAHYTATAPGGSVTADATTGAAIGFVGEAILADETTLRYAFLEGPALAMLGPVRGYVALHASAVVTGGMAIALQGGAGVGKSTLALAAARRGRQVLAEDAVWIRDGADGLEAWGMPWIQRLMPDAPRFFPELAKVGRRVQANGESKLVIDLDTLFPGRAVPTAPLGAIVLLERRPGGPTRLEPALDATIEVLWPWGGWWTDRHDALAERIGRLPVHRLVVGGSPDAAIDALDAVDPLGPVAADRVAGPSR